MGLWSNILYELGRYLVTLELSQCPKDSTDNDETRASVIKRRTLRKQLRRMTVSELENNYPEQAQLIMHLTNSVTSEIIQDVWTNPHDEIVTSIEALFHAITNQDEGLKTILHQTRGIWETLRMMSRCDAFLKASVADKAFLLVSNWGWISFEKFRIVLQLFFGLNDIQILAILWGQKDRGGELRIIQTENEPFDIVEPVYSSMHKEYATRCAYDDMIMSFKPYIPMDGDWGHTHFMYQTFLSCIQDGCKVISPEIVKWIECLAIFNSDTMEQEFMDVHPLFVRRLIALGQDFWPYIVQIMDSKRRHLDSSLENDVMQSIMFSGIPIALEDLFIVGRQHHAEELNVMKILWQHRDEIVICDEGESVRMMRVNEYKEGTHIDLSDRDKNESYTNYTSENEQMSKRLESVIGCYKKKYESYSFNNLAEKVLAFLQLWGDEIQLKLLQEVALKLNLTTSPKSVSRVLRSYPNCFYSCECIGKRGYWCCREVAIRKGFKI